MRMKAISVLTLTLAISGFVSAGDENPLQPASAQVEPLILAFADPADAGASADAQVTASGSQDDSVYFVRDVLSLLNGLGCNATACHGSATGKGGLKFDVGSGQYNTLASWVAKGLPYRDENAPDLVSIAVVLKEQVLEKGKSHQLQVTANDCRQSAIVASYMRRFDAVRNAVPQPLPSGFPEVKSTTEWKEEIVYINPAQTMRHPRTGEVVKPQFLGGQIAEVDPGADPRAVFAQWPSGGFSTPRSSPGSASSEERRRSPKVLPGTAGDITTATSTLPSWQVVDSKEAWSSEKLTQKENSPKSERSIRGTCRPACIRCWVSIPWAACLTRTAAWPTSPPWRPATSRAEGC